MANNIQPEMIRTTKNQRERFAYALEQVVGKDHVRDGIGTLSEKTVHAVLKYYYEPDSSHHEIQLEKSVADIFTGDEVIEIQTRALYRLKPKLDKFLPFYPVTVVYPISYDKWVCWINEETGEITQKRKSPKKGNPYLAFKELYTIRNFLQDPNFHVRLVLMDMEEYRILNGWSKDKKRGGERFDRLPLRLEDEVVLDSARDYLQLLPLELAEEFTSADFAKLVKIPRQLAGTVLLVLWQLGLVERVGKVGNRYLYRVAANASDTKDSASS